MLRLDLALGLRTGLVAAPNIAEPCRIAPGRNVTDRQRSTQSPLSRQQLGGARSRWTIARCALLQ